MTPFHRDVIEKLAGICQKVNLEFELFYSQHLDWAQTQRWRPPYQTISHLKCEVRWLRKDPIACTADHQSCSRIGARF